MTRLFPVNLNIMYKVRLRFFLSKIKNNINLFLTEVA